LFSSILKENIKIMVRINIIMAKSQISVFIVVGLVVIVLIALALNMNGDVKDTPVTTPVVNQQQLSGMIEECVDELTVNILKDTGVTENNVEHVIETRLQRCVDLSTIPYARADGTVVADALLSDDEKTLGVTVKYPIVIENDESAGFRDTFNIDVALDSQMTLPFNIGVTTREIRVSSKDDEAELIIPAGTMATMPNGAPVESVSITIVDSAQHRGDPFGNTLFRLEPHGARFSPPVILRIKYDETSLKQFYDEPDAERKISVGYFEKTAEPEWMPSVIYINSDIIEGRLSHFSDAGIGLPPCGTDHACETDQNTGEPCESGTVNCDCYGHCGSAGTVEDCDELCQSGHIDGSYADILVEGSDYNLRIGNAVYKGARGSDNWPTTWASNNNIYTSWGDGEGFQGSARASLGIAKMSGSPSNPGGSDIYEGMDGKSYGMIAIGNTLYMFVAPGSGDTNMQYFHLYKSSNGGSSWSKMWKGPSDLINPSVLQYNKGHSGQEYVYVYSVGKKQSKLAIQRPGYLFLMRMRANNMNSVEYFSGTSDNPSWSSSASSKKPVLTDEKGFGWAPPAVSYNKHQGVYMMVTDYHPGSGTPLSGSGFAMYEAEKPWGPWNLVTKMDKFVDEPSFYYNLPVKWMSEDEMYLVYTGTGSNDAIIIRKMSVEEKEGGVPGDAPAGCVVDCSTNDDCASNKNIKCHDRFRCFNGKCAQCDPAKNFKQGSITINNHCSQTTRGKNRNCGSDYMCYPVN